MRALLFLWLVGCARGMGEPCTNTDECVDGGVCLAGACSGYACDRDDDCENGLVCGEVAGVSACVAECSDDDACVGEQRCRAQDTGPGVCL